jgi:hypothetical protein
MVGDARDEIGYGRLVQQALRGVVRSALQHAAGEGLPGEHHFYVSFRTGAEGVALPAGLAAQFPDEMTLILQHQFWNLEVHERAFSVTLRFGGQPERLTIPFEALTSFVDPSVEFALRFVPGHEPAGEEPPEHQPGEPVASSAARAPEPGAMGRGQDKVVDLAAFKKPRRRPRPAD